MHLLIFFFSKGEIMYCVAYYGHAGEYKLDNRLFDSLEDAKIFAKEVFGDIYKLERLSDV